MSKSKQKAKLLSSKANAASTVAKAKQVSKRGKQVPADSKPWPWPTRKSVKATAKAAPFKRNEIKVRALWRQNDIGLQGYIGAVLADGTPVALCSGEKWDLGPKDSLRKGWVVATQVSYKVFGFGRRKSAFVDYTEAELRENGLGIGKLKLTVPTILHGMVKTVPGEEPCGAPTLVAKQLKFRDLGLMDVFKSVSGTAGVKLGNSSALLGIDVELDTKAALYSSAMYKGRVRQQEPVELVRAFSPK